MTRFARARGSKSSNERLPEDATSWHTMREQMEDKQREVSETKKRKEFEDKRKENYKNFLEERENDVKPQWADFEQSSMNIKDSKKSKKKKNRESSESINEEFNLEEVVGQIEKVLENGDHLTSKKKRKLNVESVDVSTEQLNENGETPPKKKKKDKLKSRDKIEQESIQFSTSKKKKKLNIESVDVSTAQLNENGETPPKKKKKDKLKSRDKIEQESIQFNANSDDDAPDESSAKIKPTILKNKKTKSHKKELLQIPSVIEQGDSEDKVQIEGGNIVKKEKIKKKKTDAPKPKKALEEMTEDEIKRFDKKKVKRMRQLENKKMRKALERETKLAAEQQSHYENIKNRKLPKVRDDKEHSRRKPNDIIKTMNINGIDIEIDYVDGFPVKKEDAERLRKLRKEMIGKSIPKSEVQIALKLERRRAEKALAREKRNVCFNCRKSGHNLSECPNLNDNSQNEMNGTGICFKCGSTEHTHFQCKVVRTDNYKYATCFICHEQGHISRQCPDNQKGLYPKGGACKVCGDVTHLKKDCPKFQEQQESQTIKLDVMDGGDLEGISGEKNYKKRDSNKFNKVVKF